MEKEADFFTGLASALTQASNKAVMVIEKLSIGSSQYKTMIHELLSRNQRMQAFDILVKITSEIKKNDYLDSVLLAGRFLLVNQLISECYIFLTICQEKVVEVYGEPIDYSLIEEIGNMFYLSGQTEIAITWYEKLMEMNEAPESRMYFNIGMCYQVEENYKKAIENYIKSTYADPKFNKSWINLGYCYIQDHQPDKALQSFQQLPLSGENLICVGNAHFRMGNYEEAIAFYLRSVELKEDSGAYNNLGIALKKVGLLNDAINAFSDSLALKPNSEAAVNLVTLYFELGKRSEAQNLLRICGKIIPEKQLKAITKQLEQKLLAYKANLTNRSSLEAVALHTNRKTMIAKPSGIMPVTSSRIPAKSPQFHRKKAND
ncbi:hypothetical protein SteCoe_6325 [Stentor coeruleus]|uniref:Uncharacterized protein n=1 Tax=Stentor coeruleus TaxID=5963 RepID=A0A1R2CQ76_9CILI|nr:hypothetical protein SteCoe_6325 [Stentor coeruleus]